MQAKENVTLFGIQAQSCLNKKVYLEKDSFCKGNGRFGGGVKRQFVSWAADS